MIPEKARASASPRRNISFVRAGAKKARRVDPNVEERARELLTMAAHDLRSPLAVLKMIASRVIWRWRAGEEPTGGEWVEIVMSMSRTADDAFSLIDDLLAMERLAQDDRAAPTPSVIDVEKVVEEAIAHQSEILDRARCKVTVVRHKGLRHARGAWDRGYLLRVLWNLLRNVARHAPGAPVNVTLARRAGNRLGIVFADRGPGLREPAAGRTDNRITDTLSKTASHGLGLWIVRRAIEHLDGRLQIRNTPGRGLAFDIELPGLEH